MFVDLQERAKLKANVVKVSDARRKEVKRMFRCIVEGVLPDIEALGFEKVTLFKYDTSFELRIQPRRGYSGHDFTHNLELASIKDAIHYGCGANSAKGKAIPFDYNWNDSKLTAIMKDALRAVVGAALNAKEMAEAKGWNK